METVVISLDLLTEGVEAWKLVIWEGVIFWENADRFYEQLSIIGIKFSSLINFKEVKKKKKN
jgi:hypothetical protein